jgi:hypothetical protein
VWLWMPVILIGPCRAHQIRAVVRAMAAGIRCPGMEVGRRGRRVIRSWVWARSWADTVNSIGSTGLAGRFPVAFALSLVARDAGGLRSSGLLRVELDMSFQNITCQRLHISRWQKTWRLKHLLTSSCICVRRSDTGAGAASHATWHGASGVPF